jgi:hypothetical protein
LLTEAAGRTAPLEDDLGRPDAGLVGVVQEEGEGNGEVRNNASDFFLDTLGDCP